MPRGSAVITECDFRGIAQAVLDKVGASVIPGSVHGPLDDPIMCDVYFSTRAPLADGVVRAIKQTAGVSGLWGYDELL